MSQWRAQRKRAGRALVLAALLMVALVQAIGSAPPAGAATVTLTPVADTTVTESTPAATAGSASLLTVDGSPVTQVLVRFDLRDVSGTVQSAHLRLHVDSSKGSESVAGGVVGTSPNTSWSQASTSWNTRPAISGSILDTIGEVSRKTWVEATVTDGVVTGQFVTFAITSTDPDAAIYDSSETDSTAPQLVLTTGPASSTSSTTTSTTTATTTTTLAPPA